MCNDYYVSVDEKEGITNLSKWDHIVVFGFGKKGKQVVDFLMNRDYKVSEIWDNYSDQDSYRNVKICKPNQNLSKNTIIIIAVAVFEVFQELYSQVVQLGYSDILHYQNVFLGQTLSYDEYRNFMVEIQTAKLDAQKSKFGQDSLILDHLELHVTEKCSLKCKECSNLMQYFEAPKELDVQETIEDIKRVLNSVDYIVDFRILGGEPFTSRNLYVYVNLLSECSNVGMISIYTNGTIVPVGENLECLKNNKVFVRISDYGQVSRNLKKLEEACRSNKIPYEVIPYSRWTHCAEFKKQSRTEDENKEVLRRCCANTLMALKNHKIFRCPFLAGVWSLQAIPQAAIEYVDINAKDEVPLKQRISAYLKQDYLAACEYCPGRSRGVVGDIPAAEQISAPIKYQKYPFNT